MELELGNGVRKPRAPAENRRRPKVEGRAAAQPGNFVGGGGVKHTHLRSLEAVEPGLGKRVFSRTSCSAKVRPVDACTAALPISACQRRMAVSTWSGSSSIAAALRPVLSAAMIVVPEPT